MHVFKCTVKVLIASCLISELGCNIDSETRVTLRLLVFSWTAWNIIYNHVKRINGQSAYYSAEEMPKDWHWSQKCTKGGFRDWLYVWGGYFRGGSWSGMLSHPTLPEFYQWDVVKESVLIVILIPYVKMLIKDGYHISVTATNCVNEYVKYCWQISVLI